MSAYKTVVMYNPSLMAPRLEKEIQDKISEYAKDGWKLKNCLEIHVTPSALGFLFVFEK